MWKAIPGIPVNDLFWYCLSARLLFWFYHAIFYYIIIASTIILPIILSNVFDFFPYISNEYDVSEIWLLWFNLNYKVIIELITCIIQPLRNLFYVTFILSADIIQDNRYLQRDFLMLIVEECLKTMLARWYKKYTNIQPACFGAGCYIEMATLYHCRQVKTGFRRQIDHSRSLMNHESMQSLWKIVSR